MVSSIDELRRALAGAPLAGNRMLEVLVPGSGEKALVVETEPDERWAAWQQARDALEYTSRWPVVSASFAGGQWPSCVVADDMFARGEYTYELEPGTDVSPSAIIERSRSRTADQLVEETLREVPEIFDDDFDYEGDDYISGFDPTGMPTYLVLLPTAHSWHALAYMHFWASGNAESHLALLASWRERYGAELVAHYGTMLEFRVERPPRTLEQALPLAREQVAAAPCTTLLPCVGLTAHARALVGRTHWFLHERP